MPSNNAKLTGANKMQKAIRQATKADFKIRTVLIDSEGYTFRINQPSGVKGVWDTSEGKCVFEREAKFYNVDQKQLDRAVEWN